MKTNRMGKIPLIACLGVALTLNAAPVAEEEFESQDIKDLFLGERAYQNAAALVDLGKRVAAGPAEHLAAEWIAAEMAGYGLEVEVQTFEQTYFEDFGSMVEVVGGDRLGSVTMYYSPHGEVTAPLVYCGLGETGDFGDVVGCIALMLRGEIPYSQKVANAALAGAAACIVFNSAPEIMYATLGSMADIPAVSLSGQEGLALVDSLAQGPVTVHFKVDSEYYDSVSHNIIATRPGRDPDQGIVYMGAHYDSVWFGPGANDNASGLGCLLEAARVLSTKGHATKATIKFIAFGSEEPGLDGSAAYVMGNMEEVASQGLGMVNLDMVGVGDILLLGCIGWADPGLALYAQEKAERMGIASWAPAEMTTNSDHTYFEWVGVPVVRFEQSPDPYYHSSEDSMDKIDPTILEANGEVATAVVYDWAKNPNLRAKQAAKQMAVVSSDRSFQAE